MSLDLTRIKAAHARLLADAINCKAGYINGKDVSRYGESDEADDCADILNETPALIAEVERLQAECFALAAHQCRHPSGDEYGNPMCEEVERLQKRVTDLQESNNRYEQQARDARAAHLANGKILEAVQLALVRSEDEVERLEQELATAKAVGAADDAIIFVPTGERKWQFQAMEYFLTEEGNIAYFNQPTEWPYTKDNPRPIYKMERAAEIRKGIK